MENQLKLSLKVQFGDKVKRLCEKVYAELDELKTIIEASFKTLVPKTYVLKYKDNEGDWLYIFDNSDLQALKEYFYEKNGKVIKLVVESQEELATSTIKPIKLSESVLQKSAVKDSCVAEVEAFLQAEKEKNKEEEKDSIELLKETVSVDEEEPEPQVEIEEPEPKVEVEEPLVELEKIEEKQETSQDSKLVDELQEIMENATQKPSETKASEEQEINIEPVIIEETSAFEEVKILPVPTEEEEEVIDTSNKNSEEQVPVETPQEEKKEEKRDFNIMELFNNINDVMNKDDDDYKPKDLVKTIKNSVKGTKAENKFKKISNQFKKGRGFFMKRIFKNIFQGLTCDNEEKKSTVVHPGITCDGCNKSPVVGVRYKCSECPDYDLCEDCEKKDVHNHHVFLKVKNPMKVDIIYSHRTNDDGEAFNSTHPPSQPIHQPQSARNPPCGGPFGGQWGNNQGWNNTWAGHGGRGHRRCPRNMGNMANNPLMALAQQFLGGFDNDEESGSPQRQNRRGGKNWAQKRPVIVNKPEGPISGCAGGMAVVETTVQNQSPFPYNLKDVKMIEADEGIQFQEINTDVRLKRDESQDFCLAVSLPQAPGTYKARFGFFNKNNQQHGEVLDVVFEVLPETSQ